MPLTNELEAMRDYAKEQLGFIEETNRRFRQNQRIMLCEFVDFLNQCHYEIGNNSIMDKHIEQFLDQNEIKWEQKTGKVFISHKGDE